MKIIQRHKLVKTEEAFQKVRSIYLGSVKKKHSKTGYFGKRDKNYVSWGFTQKVITEYIAPAVYNFINRGSYLDNLVLINDFTFELTNWFISTFSAIKKITVAFIIKDDADKANIERWLKYFIGTEQIKIIYIKQDEYKMPKFRSNGLPLIDKETGEQKYNIFTRWNLGELTNMKKIGLVVSNPAYGKIGADITEDVRVAVDYKDFINLLPANDYNRGKNKELHNYQSGMLPIKNGFEGDATVTTHLARIHKNKVNNMTLDEFEVSQYTDKSLTKYFMENRIRKHYAIDSANLSGATDRQFKQFNLDTTVTVSSRDVNHKHLPYSKTCETYRYNVLKNISNAEIFESRKALRKGVYDGWLSITGILNKTKIEKDNQVTFMYSKDGFRFLAKVFTACNVDGTLNFGKVFPKVDWTKSWTVEEILADYGYTADEIKEVMNDLVNYKGMDD